MSIEKNSRGFLIGLILIKYGQIFELNDEKKRNDWDLSVLCIISNFGAQASESEYRKCQYRLRVILSIHES